MQAMQTTSSDGSSQRSGRRSRTDANGRQRAMEVAFIASGYRCGIDVELAALDDALAAAAGVEQPLRDALRDLARRLTCRELMQSRHVLPLFEAGRACPTRLAEAWAADALRVFAEIDRVRAATATATASAPRGALVARVCRVLDSLADHLAVEARVLGDWARRAPAARPAD